MKMYLVIRKDMQSTGIKTVLLRQGLDQVILLLLMIGILLKNLVLYLLLGIHSSKKTHQLIELLLLLLSLTLYLIASLV